jgi:uncharacterized protein
MISNHNLRSHRIDGLLPGPRLIVTGAVHGNETAGTKGIRRILAAIDSSDIDIVRGSVTFVPVSNPLAYNHMRRAGDRNLNRRLRPQAPGDTSPGDYEDRVANALCPLLAAHDVLLDLHSFRSPGQPFVLRGPANNLGPLEPFAHEAAEAQLAAHVGVSRVVDGWMDAYATGVARRQARARAAGLATGVQHDASYGVGTTEYMRSQGGYAVTLECGQHEDPAGPDVAYHAIRQTLALLGLADLPLQAPAAPAECLTLAEVTDRHDAADQFAQPWTSFTPLAAGELIGVRAGGAEVRAPDAGYIVFPDHHALPGNEWFYFAKPSSRRL